MYRLVKPACQPAEYDEIVLLDGTGQAQIDVWMRRLIFEREDSLTSLSSARSFSSKAATHFMRSVESWSSS